MGKSFAASHLEAGEVGFEMLDADQAKHPAHAEAIRLLVDQDTFFDEIYAVGNASVGLPAQNERARLARTMGVLLGDEVGVRLGRRHQVWRAVDLGRIVGLDEVKTPMAAAVEVVFLVAVPMEERYAGAQVVAAVGIAWDSEGGSGNLIAV